MLTVRYPKWDTLLINTDFYGNWLALALAQQTKGHHYPGSPDKLLVEYDPHYGFPASLEVDYSPFIADDEFSYRLTDFQAY
ncbi:DUF6174 domain-containing protein [Marinobacter shengliensis]|uniref:DUF6174 domain-containing protein n=1 Tax=Marinobacter shengliensis TaxID=1389223 RepID=UPI0011B20F3C|nr:DUF6174 domain-containing protein [Marinobacter shengliensis]